MIGSILYGSDGDMRPGEYAHEYDESYVRQADDGQPVLYQLAQCVGWQYIAEPRQDSSAGGRGLSAFVHQPYLILGSR